MMSDKRRRQITDVVNIIKFIGRVWQWIKGRSTEKPSKGKP